MHQTLKASLWGLSLLTVVYISNQHLTAQRLRASQHTGHSTHSDQSFRLTQIGSRVMRVNETTGETYYWSPDEGGWVLIRETNLQTIAPQSTQNLTLTLKGRITAIDTIDANRFMIKLLDENGFETPIEVSGNDFSREKFQIGTIVEAAYTFDINTARRHLFRINTGSSD